MIATDHNLRCEVYHVPACVARLKVRHFTKTWALQVKSEVETLKARGAPNSDAISGPVFKKMQPSRRGGHGPSNSSNYPHSYPSNVYSNPSLMHRNDNSLGARAAHALTSALADPYGQTRSFYSYTNPNYAQAYLNQMRIQQQRPLTTEEGYTLSSTYDPSSEMAPNASASTSSARPDGSHNRNIPPRYNGQSSSSFHNRTRTGSNYPNQQQHPPQHPPQRRPPAPGDIRCTHPGCQFSGSKQTVEIHKMDRHLIFPPGWKKKADDWDADPSLKGRPIPILGTGLVLNTQESIDAWIAERKKKWPSKQNVEEKKKRGQEAEERGQINPRDLTDHATKGFKRRRFDNTSEGRKQQQRLPNIQKRAKVTHAPKGGENDIDNLGEGSSEVKAPSTTRLHNPIDPATERFASSSILSAFSSGIPNTVYSSTHSNGEDDEGNTDIDPIKDAISSKKPDNIPEEYPSPTPDKDKLYIPATLSRNQLSAHQSKALHKKKTPPQLKQPSRNPFGSKNGLLRNLLLPEIRHTVSNLSQAIHFLVENDCLNSVELKPGDADAQPIQVIENQKETSTE